jgi:hypothetical protein
MLSHGIISCASCKLTLISLSLSNNILYKTFFKRNNIYNKNSKGGGGNELTIKC